MALLAASLAFWQPWIELGYRKCHWLHFYLSVTCRELKSVFIDMINEWRSYEMLLTKRKKLIYQQKLDINDTIIKVYKTLLYKGLQYIFVKSTPHPRFRKCLDL